MVGKGKVTPEAVCVKTYRCYFISLISIDGIEGLKMEKELYLQN